MRLLLITIVVAVSGISLPSHAEAQGVVPRADQTPIGRYSQRQAANETLGQTTAPQYNTFNPSAYQSYYPNTTLGNGYGNTYYGAPIYYGNPGYAYPSYGNSGYGYVYPNYGYPTYRYPSYRVRTQTQPSRSTTSGSNYFGDPHGSQYFGAPNASQSFGR